MLDQHEKDGQATRQALTEMTAEFKSIHSRLGNIEEALEVVGSKIKEGAQ